MTFEELIERKGKYVLLYLPPIKKWMKVKVMVTGTIKLNEDGDVVKGADAVYLKGSNSEFDVKSDLIYDDEGVRSYQIKIKP